MWMPQSLPSPISSHKRFVDTAAVAASVLLGSCERKTKKQFGLFWLTMWKETRSVLRSTLQSACSIDRWSLQYSGAEHCGRPEKRSRSEIMGLYIKSKRGRIENSNEGREKLLLLLDWPTAVGPFGCIGKIYSFIAHSIVQKGNKTSAEMSLIAKLFPLLLPH